MDREDEFNDAMRGFFKNAHQHHNTWGAYEFEPQRKKRPFSTEEAWNDKKPEGVITILSTPPKVKPEAYTNKSRRFRKDLNVEAIGLTTQVDRASIVGFHAREVLVLKVNGEVVEVSESLTKQIHDGVYIVPHIQVIRPRRIRHNSKRITLTELFYLCIVESQYIQFEEV